MSTKPAAEVEIRLDKERAEKEAKGFASNLAQALGGIHSALGLASSAFNAIAGAITGAAETAIGWAKAASEAEAADRKLVIALKQRGEFTAAAADELRALNAQIQATTGISGDELAAIQGTMSALGVKRTKLEEATKAAIGLAEITGQDLPAAALAVSKAMLGSETALRKVGIAAKDGATGVADLAKAFEFAEARGRTVEGQAKILTENLGDIEESLGGAFTRSEALRDGLALVAVVVGDVSAAFASQDGRVAVDGFFRAIATGIADTINLMLGMRTFMEDEIFQKWRNWKAALTGDPVVVASTPNADALAASAQSVADRFQSIGAGAARTIDPAAGGGGKRRGPAGDLGGAQKAAAKEFEQFQQEAKRTAQRVAKERNAESMAAFLTNADEEASAILLAGDIKTQAEFEAGLQQNAAKQRVLDDAFNQQQAHNDAVDGLLAQGAQMASTGIANTIAGMVSAIASGKGDLDAIAGQMVGGILTNLGTMLISMGTAGVLAGTLGTFIPAFAALTGGPLGVGAGLAAIVGGTALVALGSALGGASKGGAPSSARGASVGTGDRSRSPGAAGRGRGFDSAAPQGFVPSGREQPRTTVINVSMTGLMSGSERGLAREIKRVLGSGATLNPAGA